MALTLEGAKPILQRDLYNAFYSISLSTHDTIIAYLAMALIYLGLVLLITLLVKVLERSLGKSDRRI